MTYAKQQNLELSRFGVAARIPGPSSLMRALEEKFHNHNKGAEPVRSCPPSLGFGGGLWYGKDAG